MSSLDYPVLEFCFLPFQPQLSTSCMLLQQLMTFVVTIGMNKVVSLISPLANGPIAMLYHTTTCPQ